MVEKLHQKSTHIPVFSRTFDEIPVFKANHKIPVFKANYKIPVFSRFSRMCTNPVKAKMYAISSDTHQLQFMKLHYFKQERF